MHYLIYGKQDDYIPAVAICSWAVADLGHSVTLISSPMNQPIELNYTEQDTVYFIGYSFNQETKEVIFDLLRDGVTVVWLDNHRTSFDIYCQLMEKSMNENLTALIDPTKSVVTLCWEHFHRNTPLPQFVSLLEKWGTVWNV